MTSKTKLISNELFNKALAELEALGKYGKLSTRLQLIIISKNHSITSAAKIFGFNRLSVAKWIKRFDKEGISGLEDKTGKGRKTLSNQKIILELEDLIKQDSTITLKKLKLAIQKKFDIILSKSTIHNYTKSLGFSHITARPKHHKQNKIHLEEFKKNLEEIHKNNEDKLILFFDESRFGTKTKTGLGWFKKGTRTPIKVKLGFKNFYLYSSVNPKDGENFTLLLPFVNTDCMNSYLNELSKAINKNIILIVDGAGWHKSKNLIIPNNIQIVLLPPYCPELNPVERLWKYIKDNTIKNKVFETLSLLEDEVCGFVAKLTKDIVKNICRCD